MNKIVQSMMDIARGQSTGLGLAYDIIKAHGGIIEVKSNYSSQSGHPDGTQEEVRAESVGMESQIKLPI